VANVLVYIECTDRGDRPSEASLECLGEARRIASFLGATLSAVLPCAAPPQYGDDDVFAVLGRHGADKVVVISSPELSGPALWVSQGHALAHVCEKVPPSLVLAAATAAGRDLMPRLAARLGAAYVPEPSIEYGPRGDLVMSRTVYGGSFRRRLSADDLERPVVATLTPGSYQKAIGSDDAEAVVMAGPSYHPTLTEVARKPDPGAALDAARVIVTAGAGVAREHWGLVREVARTLGGEAAVTRAALAAGLGEPELAIGLTGRSVAPRLYIAVGASGSPAHLQAVSPDTTIVAVNSDPSAPIFRVAAYGIIGDAATVLPKLASALRNALAVEKAS
jgi:electron transfer flavoprotein alpha subunit